MNNVINKFLLAGDKFMPEMHLRQPRFVYSVCDPFTRHKERIKEFKRTGDTRYIYRNELDKACFQHDSAYADHKDLINRNEADKVLRDKAYDIASNPKCDGYQRGLASMVYKSFDKKSTAEPSSLERTMSGFKKLKNTTKPSSSILADELHKPIIRKFNKRKVCSHFKDNIWGVDLADMQSLSRKNKGIKYLLCAIDLYSKYTFVIPLKDKKGISIVNAFNKIIKQSNRKPNKIWVDQGGEFYNNVVEKWLSDNDINMYSTYNEGKSVVAERFIRTLKNKLYKHLTTTGKNVYYDVLDDVVNKISTWKSTGIFNYSSDSNMNAVGDSGGDLPDIKNDGRIYVYLSGNHFQQNKVIIPNNNNAINIYCVYKLDAIAFTIQNALFGAMQITKDATNNCSYNVLILKTVETY